MTVEEIFVGLAQHMKKGISMHRDMILVFSFLDLLGYKECLRYHYLEEIDNCLHLMDCYMNYYYKLLKVLEEEKLEVIPVSWHKYTKFDVDTSTKRNEIKNILNLWVNWERDTKKYILQLYTEADNLGDYSAALVLLDLLKDVNEELIEAEHILLELESCGYDIVYIIDALNTIYEDYKKRIKNIYKRG